MISLIYIQVLDRYWDAGKKLGLSEDEKLMFHKFIANEYKRLVVQAIDDQRFRSKWTSLTIGYLNYKKSHGYPTNMWELTGELKKSLKVSKRSQVYIVGFPKRKHSGTSLTILELAKVLEFGSLRIPPRPLFRLVYRYMSSNIEFFYKKFSLGRK